MAVGILQTFWYLHPITHSTPKLFTKKYPYLPEIHSISISIRVTHSMKGSTHDSKDFEYNDSIQFMIQMTFE